MAPTEQTVRGRDIRCLSRKNCQRQPRIKEQERGGRDREERRGGCARSSGEFVSHSCATAIRGLHDYRAAGQLLYLGFGFGFENAFRILSSDMDNYVFKSCWDKTCNERTL